MDTEQPRAPAIPKRFSGNTLTASLLQKAVGAFSSDRGPAINAIRQLQSSDPSGLAHAAIQILSTAEEKSLPLKNAVGLLTVGNLLAGLLMKRHILSLETGLARARKARSMEPLLDIQLVRQLVANSSGKVAAIKNAEALHTLELVDAISDCSRLGSYLIQFLKHPNDKVRSKAALMLGR